MMAHQEANLNNNVYCTTNQARIQKYTEGRNSMFWDVWQLSRFQSPGSSIHLWYNIAGDLRHAPWAPESLLSNILHQGKGWAAPLSSLCLCCLRSLHSN